MSKKKKSIKVVKPKSPDANIAISNVQKIAYEGKLQVSLLHGNKVVSTKEYKNNGLPKLFKFIGTALVGQYSTTLAPAKIKLFKISGIDYANFKWDTAFESTSEHKAVEVSAFVGYDSSPVMKRVENSGVIGTISDQDHHYEVTYHFRVPYAYIFDTAVYFVGLYSQGSSLNKDASAYYAFTKIEDGVTVWDPMEIKDGDGANYSIIISWTLSVSNS